VKRRSRKIEVTEAPGVPRGTWLQIGDGDQSEMVQVVSSRGTTVRFGVRWWHRVIWRLRVMPTRVGTWLRWRLCAAAGHRVTCEAVIGLRHCWCRRRWEDGADWDDEEVDW